MTLRLFEGFGIELEYMIVDSESLSVRPLADQLLAEVGGGYETEVELGDMAWSNELALHVVEMKTNGPAGSLTGLGHRFQGQVERIDRLLAPMGARLLPTAMHPWMEPERELRLWPHEDDTIYRTFDRIFDCRGHGWANLQSMHINLPFADDDELDRLHAAIRLVLPLLPGLAASSPFVDGRASGLLDSRLEMYRHNARRVPSVSGFVVPEELGSRRQYQALLQRIYDDLAPLDPEGVLAHEWVNARGCIARFDRMALEIRLLDLQECPQADLAVAAAVVAAVRGLVDEVWSDRRHQRGWDERELGDILVRGIRDADDAVVDNPRFLALFGIRQPARRVREVWQHVIETQLAGQPAYAEWRPALELIVGEGCLARRIVEVTGPSPGRVRLTAAYRRLADCLASGTLFRARP